MNIVFLILMGISMLVVLASLTTGLVFMAKGGELNKKYGNKLMQIRVY